MKNNNNNNAKSLVAREATLCIKSNLSLGLGSGSTMTFFLSHLAERLARYEISNVVGLATSIDTEKIAKSLKIPLIYFEDLGNKKLDLYVDGADQCTENGHLVKGAGGALLAEKIIFNISKKAIIIVDNTKISPLLNVKLPIEIVSFGFQETVRQIEQCLSLEKENIILRQHSSPYNNSVFQTDNKNYIVDAYINLYAYNKNPVNVAQKLKNLTGVIETGLFFLRKGDEIFVSSELKNSFEKISIHS